MSWAGEKKGASVKLKPGEARSVFKDTLRAVLLLDVKEQVGKPPLQTKGQEGEGERFVSRQE